MAFSTDSDLLDLIPDILDFGVESFLSEQVLAQSDIERELRNKWWNKRGLQGEMDSSLLTESQFRLASAYLTLWKYALPQLTNWVDGDRFQSMIEFYKSRYSEEMAAIFEDGVDYDADDDGTVTEDEKRAYSAGRLNR